MVNESFLALACAGLIGILFGLVVCFAGYRLFLVLLPLAMTMALIWKIKEVILSSVFGPEH